MAYDAAARVKLANLGLFLPYSVLSGFFSTVGVLMWTLGFSVRLPIDDSSILLLVRFIEIESSRDSHLSVATPCGSRSARMFRYSSFVAIFLSLFSLHRSIQEKRLEQ